MQPCASFQLMSALFKVMDAFPCLNSLSVLSFDFLLLVTEGDVDNVAPGLDERPEYPPLPLVCVEVLRVAFARICWNWSTLSSRKNCQRRWLMKRGDERWRTSPTQTLRRWRLAVTLEDHCVLPGAGIGWKPRREGLEEDIERGESFSMGLCYCSGRECTRRSCKQIRCGALSNEVRCDTLRQS